MRITWTNTTKRLGELKPWTLNPRQSSKKQAARLLASWEEFGEVQTIAIGPDCEVYDGHQRLSALLAVHGAGYEIDVRQSSRPLTDAERRKLVAMLHAGAVGSWDWDALSSWDAGDLMAWGFDTATLADWKRDVGALDNLIESEKPDPPEDPGADIDRAEELRELWGVEPGQLWRVPSKTGEGEHRIICGDCTDAEVVARVMEGERADCVFTSPPYAVGVDYGDTYQDTIDNLREMLPKLSALWMENVVPGGFAVVNYGDIVSGQSFLKTGEPCQYPTALEYWPVFRGAGWLLWSQRIWCKPIGRVSAPWCASSNRGATNYEHIWTWRKPGGDRTSPKTGGEYSSMHGWRDSSQMHGVDEGKGTHGAGMAVGIAEWMVHVHTSEGGIVHEPFCGTGTTAVACERLGRLCRGVEISPAYVAVSLQRLADMGLEPYLSDEE